MIKCVVTGEIPAEPVISKKSGHVFEKKIIEKIIKAENKCPVTGEDLAMDDLVSLQTSEKFVQARPPNDTSIPNLLKVFQNEWDALMLESFKIKKHLRDVRQELSHALYQHDAACRVIARVVKERDHAREELANTQQSMSIAIQGSQRMAMEVDEAGIDDATVARIKSKHDELSALRKKNKRAPEKLAKATIEEWSKKSSAVKSYHLVGNSGVPCCAVDPNSEALKPRIVTGGADAMINVLVYDLNTTEVVKECTLKGHRKKVLDVLINSNENVIVSTGMDGMNVWRQEDDKWTPTTIAPNGDHNTVLEMHPIEDIFIAGSHKGNVRVYKLNGAQLTETNFGSREPIRCCGVHPDGQLLAAAAGKELKIWQIGNGPDLQKVDQVDFRHDGAITSIAFSNNGYHLATSDELGTVKIWDLRKLKPVTSIQLSNIKSVAYNGSGTYLAVGTKDGKTLVFEVQRKEIIKVADFPATKDVGTICWSNTRGGHPGMDPDDFLVVTSTKSSNISIYHTST